MRSCTCLLCAPSPRFTNLLPPITSVLPQGDPREPWLDSARRTIAQATAPGSDFDRRVFAKVATDAHRAKGRRVL